MVFLSTFQVLLGRNPWGSSGGGPPFGAPPPRSSSSSSVFTTFGTRRLTQRVAVGEIASGLAVVVPLSFLAAIFTKRFAASGFLRPPFVKRDIWTTLVITFVGDLFLELLLPSVQCLPEDHPFDSYVSSSSSSAELSLLRAPLGYVAWLLRAWGLRCPHADPYHFGTDGDAYGSDYPYGYDDRDDDYNPDPSRILSTDAVGTLLTMRLIFMCLGVYLGECFCPVVLTGGIACGKSTVGRLLVANGGGGGGGGGAAASGGVAGSGVTMPSGTAGGGGRGSSPSPGQSVPVPFKARRGGGQGTRKGGGKQAKRGKAATADEDAVPSNLSSTSSAAVASYDYGEGSVLIVDTDKIAHQILLPASVLGSGGPIHSRGAWHMLGGSSTNLSFSYDDNIGGDGVEDDEDFEDNIDDESDSAGAAHPSETTSSPSRRHQPQPRTRQRPHRQPSRRRERYVVTATDSVYDKIVDAFGDESVQCRNILTTDNLIDREKLGALVFGNRDLRRRLNAITHPRIFVTMMRQLIHGSYFSSQDIVCADVPLFFETMAGLRRMFGLVVVVACTKEVQFQRLRKRNPELTSEQCWERISSQLPIGVKADLADLVIWNNGNLEDLEQEVERVRKEIVGRLYGIGMSLLQMLLLVGGSLSLAVSSKLFTSFST